MILLNYGVPALAHSPSAIGCCDTSLSRAPATLKLYERGLAEWRGFCKSHRLPTGGPRIMDSFERFFWHKADRG